MAKVTIEFDPALPAEREGVGLLFKHLVSLEYKLLDAKASPETTASVPDDPAPKPTSRQQTTQDAITMPPQPSPETKACEECGNEFARPRVISQANWLERRFCGRACATTNRHRVGHPWMPTRKNDAGEDLKSGEISADRDGNGKTKYCQQCGMLIWRAFEHRRSQLDPDKCDSCGKDPMDIEAFSEVPAIDAGRMGEVG